MWMQVRIWPNTYIFWSFGWHPEVIWRLNLPGYYPVVITQMCSQKGTSWGKDSLQRGDKSGRNVLIVLMFREPERWGLAPGMGVIRDSMVLWALGGSSSSLWEIRGDLKNWSPHFPTGWLAFWKHWNQAVSHNKSFLHLYEMLSNQIALYYPMQQSLK